MLSYFDRFPEKAKTELRNVTFCDRSRDALIPAGKYLFTEYFCTDLECDCQRLLVKVLRVESEGARLEDVATISYTWNEHNDELWSFLDADTPNPFLDPFHRQTRYASELLDFWSGMVAHDPDYVDRLKRHYHELRSAHSQPGRTSRARSDATSGTAPTLTMTQRERRARKRKLEQVKRIRKSR